MFRFITVHGALQTGMLLKQITCQGGGSKWDVKPSEMMAYLHTEHIHQPVSDTCR